MPEQITLTINGQSRTIEADPEEPLLYILREEFGLNGAKYGCGFQQCGSCMVIANGESVPTCLESCKAFEGRNIETIEGLASGEDLNPLQEAFIEQQAAQCGYCVNGMLMAGMALLRKNPTPTEKEIRVALDRIICRCGTHQRFINAIKSASSSSQKI